MPFHPTDPGIAEGVRWLLENQELVRAPKREPLPTPITSGGGMPTVTVAAVDASASSKAKADLICLGTDDQVTFRRATVMAGLWGRINLTEGGFNCNIDGVRTWEHHGIISGTGRSTVVNVAGGAGTDDFIYLAADAELRDLYIAGAGPSRMVHMAGDGMIVDKVRIFTDETGILVDAGANDSWITNSEITSFDGRAIMLNSGNYLHIVGNDLDGDLYGIDGTGSGFGDRLWIRGNNIATDGTGISIGGGQGHLIESNQITALGDGISVFNSPFFVTVKGNYVDAGADGIVMGSGSWHVIEGNIVDGPGEEGIWVQGGEWYTISGNVVNEPGRNGLRIDDQDDSTVYGNILQYAGAATTNTYDGILIFNGSDRNLLFGNRILAGIGGVVTRYGLNIDDNTCNDNVYYGNYVSLESLFGTAAYNDAGIGTMNTMPAAGGAQGDNFLLP